MSKTPKSWRKKHTKYHRFGFNNKENDRISWSSTQLVQDYGMRLYNPAIGKFLSVDPISKQYPMLTPYQFASNTPIMAIDLDGLEMFYAANGSYIGKSGTSTEIRVVPSIVTSQQIDIAKANLKNQKNNHQWLRDASQKAYVNTDNNQHEVLSKWAKQNQTPDAERAMSLFTLQINNADGKGQTEVFVEGGTVQAPPSSKKGGGGMVNPNESHTNIPGAKRSTTIHTHPSGDALNFSNELQGFMSGGMYSGL